MSSTPQWTPRKQNVLPELEPTERIKELQLISEIRGLDYKITADDKFEMYFYDLAKQNPDDLQIYIPWICRLKVNKQFVKDQKADEVLFWYEQRTITQHDGEPIQLNNNMGALLLPIPKTRNQRGKKIVTGAQGTTPYFLVPYSPEKIDEITSLSLTEVDQFHLGYGTKVGPEFITGIKRTIFNKDDFKFGSFQELWDMSSYNYSTKESRLEMWRREGDAIKKQYQTFNTMTSGVKL